MKCGVCGRENEADASFCMQCGNRIGAACAACGRPTPPDPHAQHRHEAPTSDVEQRVRALENLLVEKGYVDPAALDAIVETYESKVGPRNGAKVVAKAWVDAEYREWLLMDATAAIASLGFSGRAGADMRAVENTASVHNLIVCTLCSTRGRSSACPRSGTNRRPTDPGR